MDGGQLQVSSHTSDESLGFLEPTFHSKLFSIRNGFGITPNGPMGPFPPKGAEGALGSPWVPLPSLGSHCPPGSLGGGGGVGWGGWVGGGPWGAFGSKGPRSSRGDKIASPSLAGGAEFAGENFSGSAACAERI